MYSVFFFFYLVPLKFNLTVIDCIVQPWAEVLKLWSQKTDVKVLTLRGSSLVKTSMAGTKQNIKRRTPDQHSNESTFGSCCLSCVSWVWCCYWISLIFVCLEKRKVIDLRVWDVKNPKSGLAVKKNLLGRSSFNLSMICSCMVLGG